VLDRDGSISILKVSSLEGIIFSNILDSALVEMAERQMEIKGKIQIKPKRFIHTRVSFNGGGKWSSLVPPTKTFNGGSFTCQENCHLHLHIDATRWIGEAVAPRTAIGLVVAHGNVGTHLDYDDVSIFVSNDGGNKWRHAVPGAYKIVVGNFGGIILLARSKGLSRGLLYSLDHGENFDQFHFAPVGSEIFVEGLIADPDNSANKKFILLGRRASRNGTEGVTIIIDFNKFDVPQCRLMNEPSTKDSDFEYFYPHTNTFSSCVLGHRSTYIRKRPEVACFVNGTEGHKIR